MTEGGMVDQQQTDLKKFVEKEFRKEEAKKRLAKQKVKKVLGVYGGKWSTNCK